MKRLLFFFIAIATCMQMALAYDFSETIPSGQTLFFSFNEMGCVDITCPNPGYSNNYYSDRPTGVMVIPGSIIHNGVKWNIREISNYAFRYCTGLTSVEISDSITRVGSAFTGCTNLSSVSIGKAVSSIESYAFGECSSLNSITIYSTYCTANNNSFYGVSANITVNVPCGTASTYAAATGWSQFANITEMAATYTASVSTADSTMGIAIVNSCGNTIVATPNYGYHFDHWNDGSTDYQRVLTLTENSSFTAYFTANRYTISVTSNGNGTATGGDTKDYLEEISLTATPSVGYSFKGWKKKQSNSWGTTYYSTDNPLIVQVTENMQFQAVFEKTRHEVSVLANDSLMGYVAGGGEVEYGSSISLHAYAHAGYRFIGWSDGYSSYSRSVYVTSDTTFTALFEPIPQYIVSVGSNNSTMGTVSGGGTYYENTNTSISATPNTGCRFTGWSDGVSTNPRTINVYQDTTFTAMFEYVDYIIKAQTNNSLRGTVDGTDTVHYGETVTLTATPNEHFTFLYWQSSNGATLGGNPLTLTVTNNGTFTAYFAAEQHSVAVYSDGGGTVRIGNSGNIGNYDYFSQLTLTATANGNNAFLRWSDGNNFNPRTVTITQDTAFTALFLNGTTYLHDTIIDTVYFNHYTHDTTYINNYIHDTLMQFVNQYVHDTTFVNNYVHDTLLITIHVFDTTIVNTYQFDTNIYNTYAYDTTIINTYIYDTVWQHDTVYIHEEGIGDVDALNAKVYINDGQIVVEGAEGNPVSLYDINGRLLATRRDDFFPLRFDAPASGAYMIKIGNHPARKVVVIR